MHTFPMESILSAAAPKSYQVYDPELRSALTASRLYRRIRFRGRLRQAWSAIVRRPRVLLRLSEVTATTAMRNGYSAGVRAVPVHQIRGSEGRSADFDMAFSPLQERSRGRWLSIATARLQGAMLAPVSLIQVGNVYFVRDGHHRISVARALGQEYVDAEITVWALAAHSEPDRSFELKRACAAQSAN